MKQWASGGFYFLFLPRKAQSGSGQEVTSIKEDLLMGWGPVQPSLRLCDTSYTHISIMFRGLELSL